MVSSAHPGAARALSLLDGDERLAAVVPAPERAAARRMLAGPVLDVSPGPATALESIGAYEQVWDFYVAAGVLVRELCVSRGALPELFGPGDLLGPPAEVTSTLPVRESICAVEPTRLVVLGTRAATAFAEWPALLVEIERRRAAQRVRTSTLAAIAQLPNVELRLLAVLRHLADSWGRVSPDGTVIPFPLTHETMGRFVAARRPTVSLALQKLTDMGLARRVEGGAWLLTPDSDAALEQMLEAEGPLPPLMMRARVARLSARDAQQEASAARFASSDLSADASALQAQAAQVWRRAAEHRSSD